MATGYDEYFGFDTTQRKTLKKLIEAVAAGDTSAIEDLQTAVADLEDRVTALENAP